MDQKSYSITDLEHLTGLSRRTIHFYIQEKVIPPSEGAGGAARYSEEHLLRLQLVKQMQQSHLKLSGVKEALAGLSLEEMRELSQTLKKRPSSAWDREAIKKLTIDEPDWSMSPMFSRESPERDAGKDADLDEIGTPARSEVKEEIDSYGAATVGELEDSKKKFSLQSFFKRSRKVKERSWERFEITEGIEMNVRSDIARQHASDMKEIVDKLQAIMKKRV